MKSGITALILAAGSGKRFRPFETDKNLFPFMGKPLIAHLSDVLPAGLSEIVIVANDQNRMAMKDLRLPVSHTVVVQKEGGGMSDAVLAATSAVAGKPLLVINGDDVYAKDVLQKTLDTAEKSRAFAALPVWKTDSYFPGGYIRFRGTKPVEIVEKPKEGKEPSSYVCFGGLFVRNADGLIAGLTQVRSDSDDVYEKAVSRLMGEQDVVVVPFEEPFVSLKYPWHVLDVMSYFLIHRMSPKQGSKVTLKNNVTVEGTVHIGNNVKIYENTKITGPCFIGDNTVIGSNNIIRESYIGNNSVTGFNTDIARSYIGDNCWFHSNYIGDSVLERNVSMGSGTVLANFRLDEGSISSVIQKKKISANRTKLGSMIARDVRIGVNTSIMPGVKIGSGSMIGAGVVLDADIPDQSFVYAGGGYGVKRNTQQVAAPGARKMYKTDL